MVIKKRYGKDASNTAEASCMSEYPRMNRTRLIEMKTMNCNHTLLSLIRFLPVVSHVKPMIMGQDARIIPMLPFSSHNAISFGSGPVQPAMKRSDMMTERVSGFANQFRLVVFFFSIILSLRSMPDGDTTWCVLHIIKCQT